jgi:hypothetical protein
MNEGTDREEPRRYSKSEDPVIDFVGKYIYLPFLIFLIAGVPLYVLWMLVSSAFQSNLVVLLIFGVPAVVGVILFLLSHFDFPSHGKRQ